MRSKAETIANVSIKNIASQKSKLMGLWASQFKWTFTWSFSKGKLLVNPSLGRALIEDLLRFLFKKDYELEAGNDYKFTTQKQVLKSIFWLIINFIKII